jgi:hypothetical protein
MIADHDAFSFVTSAFVRKQQVSSAITVDRENEDAVVGQEPFQFIRPRLFVV